ncbi:glycosyltransferase family protein [Marixanthotalea marina]|uniref:hypothetical protein n=1 Tax=Marixanthotalea marina TaxID=2844359 RepID=UPI002989E39F|nr:hypothetical protein [Marixanthotalea marina]
MISICIPIYNFDVTNLVETLSFQLKTLNIFSEIVLIDDASDVSFRELNEKICSEHHYIKLDKNINR